MHVMSVSHICTSAYTTSMEISLNLLIGMLPCQLSLDPEEVINGSISLQDICNMYSTVCEKQTNLLPENASQNDTIFAKIYITLYDIKC